jgi:hypothetical protein
MNAILVPHIAAGLIAIVAGTLAVAGRKGGALHARAGTWFFASMLVLGLSAAILEPFRTPTPGSPVGGLMVCYFVATSWFAARRRDGQTGQFEIGACAIALLAGAVILWSGLTGQASSPVGPGPAIAFGLICLLAGLLDLNAILRSPMSGRQRISRHLWRMCIAFFIATGSFFLGQQDILPAAMRGSPWMFVPAFAPILIMLFWLARLRLAKAIARSKQSGRMLIGRQAAAGA